jgi:hypothetical protein
MERKQTMPTTRFTVHTTLAPREVLDLFTDFGPDRARRWPNVDDAHFTVHDQGPGWAEVTEGNAMGWERERYSWDADAGTVAIDTLDSNLWGPGSGWRYELTPAAAGGTDVHVTLTRTPNSFRGRLIGVLIPLVGARTLGKQFQSVLRKAEPA